MVAKKRNPQTVVLDPTVTVDADGLDSLDEASAEATYDDAIAPTCPSCGELLAWHEEPCEVAAAPLSEPPVTAPEEATEMLPTPTAAGFTYAIGQPVRPAPATQAGRVIWRGQVKERHPRTGLLHRVNVYRVDNGYWDCYYEAELQAA